MSRRRRIGAPLALLTPLVAAGAVGCGAGTGARGPSAHPVRAAAPPAHPVRAAGPSARPVRAAASPGQATRPGASGSAPSGSAASGSAIPPGVLIAQRTHEYPQPPVAQRVLGGWRSPAAAVRAFALVYSNWTARTLAVRLRALGLVSVGQARSLVTLQAAEAGADGELQRGGIANAATVEAIAPQSGGGEHWVVVTRERTTSSDTGAYRGLAPAWHVTLATVAPVSGGLWVVSGWQPES